MDPQSAFDAIAEVIRAIPRSGLLAGTIAALLLGWIGALMLRNKIAGGRLVRSVSTLALVGILATVFLQLARFDPRLDAVTQIGMAEQRIVGEETLVPMAADGHYWVVAEVNGVSTRFLIDTGATLTALSGEAAARAGLGPRTGGLPVGLTMRGGVVGLKRMASGEAATLSTCELAL